MSKPIPVRLDDEQIARLDVRAAERQISRSDLLRQLVATGLERPSVPEGVPLIVLSKSQRECLAQLAERAGSDTGALLTRWIGERLRREFVDGRNRLLQDISHNGRVHS